jgi:hypothetical protein
MFLVEFSECIIFLIADIGSRVPASVAFDIVFYVITVAWRALAKYLTVLIVDFEFVVRVKYPFFTIAASLGFVF